MTHHPSTRSKWSYEAYAAIPDDGKRHEIIDGDHVVNPAPNLYHQAISRRLQFQLYTAIELQELGVVINAPVDVQLSEHDIVQPDLVIVTKPHFHVLTPTKVKGAPDLLVEILLPSNSQYDLVTKRHVYQRCGVPEYWIVHPEEHRVLQLTLAEEGYREQQHEQSVTMAGPPSVVVDLKRVW